MCGICGVVQLDGVPGAVIGAEVLEAMTDVMTHRGPTDRGLYEAPGVALGMRRLAILDIEGGRQPFANERRDIWAIQNGELYNHRSLREELAHRGHRLTTTCDTEVLPHLYEDDGTGFVERLRGMFAVAVWDEPRRRLVLARDRLGIKPLYWARSGNRLVFASELKSLLASGLVDGALDYDAIDAYLTLGFIPAPLTPVSGVSKLRPGHRLVVEAGSVRIERYWQYPKPQPNRRLSDTREYADGLLAVLDEAVRLRLMSDVPVGAMLSGGLDSSLVVALMARHASGSVKTFSVGFADDPRHNELADARYVAEIFETDHHELELAFQDDSIDLGELLWSLDEPLADLSAVGFEALARVTARHVTVALCGQGADELLGGYKKHRAASLIGTWNRLPAAVRGSGGAAVSIGPKRFRRAARTLLASDPADRLIEMSGRLGNGLRETLYRGPLQGKTGTAVLRSAHTVLGDLGADPLPATLHIDAQLSLPDWLLQYFDRASMANSLEVRVPFLDHHVVEYCAQIPAALKVHRLQTKYILKQAAGGIVPERIVHKRKLGFSRGATEAWLQVQLREALPDLLMGTDVRCAEFLDHAAVRRLAMAHRDGTDLSNAHLLTAIVMLEIWLRTYLPRALSRPQASPEAATRRVG